MEGDRTYEFLVRAYPEEPRFSARVQMNTDLFARSLRSVPGEVTDKVLDHLDLTSADAVHFPDRFPLARATVSDDDYEVIDIEPPEGSAYAQRVYDHLRDGKAAEAALDAAESDGQVESDAIIYRGTRYESGDTVAAGVPRESQQGVQVSWARETPCELTVDGDADRVRLRPRPDDALLQELVLSPAQFMAHLDAHSIVPVDETE